MNILRPSPKKEDRPDINLCDKIKTTASIQVSNSPVRSLIHDEKLPSRKLVERDESLRAKKSEAQVPSPKPKLPTRKLGESDMKSPKTEQKTRKENPTKESNKQAITPTATKRKSSVTPTSSERGGASEKPPAKKSKQTKPFGKLLEGVVVALSGFTNPLRSQLRDKLLAMGAKYKPDWNNTCTHLICAFYNTPKFREVKGKGKIVTKSWVEECFSEKKRLPWRRYFLLR